MTSILLTEKKAILILFAAFLALTFCSFILIPYYDSYYFWDWSRHLAWAYYDGPPLIAYLMWIFTFVFGDNTFAINFLGVMTIYATLWFIFQTTLLLADRRVALNACLLWLFSTPVLHYLFLWVTYDNPLNMCWAAVIYFCVRYIQLERSRDLYWIGVASGFMLLAKYTGIILLGAMGLFIISHARYRILFRNMHFYGAILFTLIICSPLLIWNYQHQWESFNYLFSHHLTIHSYTSDPITSLLKFIFKIVKTYDVLLLLPLYAMFLTIKHKHAPPRAHRFLEYISYVFLVFLLVISFKNSISKHWLTPFTISSAIVCSYYFEKLRLRKWFIVTIACYFVWGIYYLLANCIFQSYFDEDFFAYALIKNAGRATLNNEHRVFTSNWQTAAKLLFWLPGKPMIYTLPCGTENQYSAWSQEALTLLKTKQIKTAFYIDFRDESACMKTYFNTCTPLAKWTKPGTSTLWLKQPTLQLFTYLCSN